MTLLKTLLGGGQEEEENIVPTAPALYQADRTGHLTCYMVEQSIHEKKS